MQVIQSPFHPQHALLLYPVPTNINNACNVCRGNIKCIAFICLECDFGLHSSCAMYQPHQIKYNRHEHHLLHLGKSIFVRTSPQCVECRQDCSDTLFYCKECKLSMHLECMELPYILKHRRHLHPLTLTSCVVEDDSGEYYCDICETQRNPELDVYYCEECTFIAHIGCVISEDEPPEEILEYLVPQRNRIEAETKRDKEKAD
ncbi:DC1 domain-containing protein [Corchorus capsularis]|uniref:DC1 domain-containing protein n=1 Tax=Corchorus capsularis TaxID=210143 RepID=A0A1R3IPJ0_COCAP|nr:DC1 domain-containing protein [Corchorus capsularis]